MALPTTLKTPDVYIDEVNAFPNSIVALETAIPAFIGYTEKSEYGGKSLKNKPVRIKNFTEFELFYGNGFKTIYDLKAVKPEEMPLNYDFKLNNIAYELSEEPGTKFNLFDLLKFFYQNGGGSCFIISIGSFKDSDSDMPFTSIAPFLEGIELLKKETEPTLLVIPDAVLFKPNDCYSLQTQMLAHCAEQKNRVAILDIYNGDKGLDDLNYNPITSFREKVTDTESLKFGAAYYPWLHTTIVQPSEIDYRNLNDDGRKMLHNICINLIDTWEVTKKQMIVNLLSNLTTDVTDVTDEKAKTVSNALSVAVPEYKIVINHILKKKNLLPPSAAMAGIFSLVDSTQGVWKAPANVAVSSVVSPAVLVNAEQQEDLNTPIDGKAICAIRHFIGLGTMVWGARTLDANSLDWRYINVRRTMIMLEQSIKLAVSAYVFEPNVKNTWVTIEAMITNFLTNLWKLGALAGAVPTDAFSVSVGLGSTMTANDILEGKMNIEVKVAVTHPAEFIVITFQQQLQKS